MRRFVASLLFCLAVSGNVLASSEELEQIARQQYLDYRTEQIRQVRFHTYGDLQGSKNIFYLAVDFAEWAQIEGILDAYFAAVGAEGYDPQRFERLAADLDGHGITVKRCIPIGYYSIWEDRVYVDEGLFQGDANPNFSKSVVYHEKVHDHQLGTLDRQVLRIDQKERYFNKLEEIGAHYGQIRYVLQSRDLEAVEKALANSNRQRMFENIRAYYPPDDPVITAIRLFLIKYAGT